MKRKNSINKEHSKEHSKEQFEQLNKKLTLFNDADLKNRKVKSAPEIGGRSSRAFSGKTAVKKIGSGKETKKIAVIVTNGSIKHYSRVWKNVKNVPGFSSDAFIAAADGGSIHCINFRIVPDLIIGDMDSITKSMVERLNSAEPGKDIEFISCSPNKDESDTQLALDHLIKCGFQKIILLGALGSSADHSFANIVLLANPAYDGTDIRIITDNSEIFVAKKSFTVEGRQGEKISLFSLTPYVYFKKTTGLLYSLKREKLLFSPVRGLSNEFTDSIAKIDFSEGELLVIKEI